MNTGSCSLLIVVILGALVSAASADVLILKDGRKISGHVVDRKDGYEVTIDGQKLAFTKDQVTRRVRKPAELLGDSDKDVEQARALYRRASKMDDLAAAQSVLKDALERAKRASVAYAEARDLFPEGYPELDRKLITIALIMRLIRNKLGTKDLGPPVAKPPGVPSALPPRPPPTVPVEAPTLPFQAALGVLADPARRSDPDDRRKSLEFLREVCLRDGAGSELATAGIELLSQKDEGAKDAKVLGEFFAAWTPVKGVPQCVKSLRKLAEAGKGSAGATLFGAAEGSRLIGRNGGEAPAGLEEVFKTLRFRQAEGGGQWGTRAGLAARDFQLWMKLREYDVGVAQFRKDYGSGGDFGMRYAGAVLALHKAVASRRDYVGAAIAFERLSRSARGKMQREHVTALAESIRLMAPCRACEGTHKVNCTTCRGKKRVNAQCNKCGGARRVLAGGKVRRCPACKGRGVYRNVKCPKCKATGTTACRARGCTRAVKAPTMAAVASSTPCRRCEGRGSMFRQVAWPCPDCLGIGRFLQPGVDRAKTLR